MPTRHGAPTRNRCVPRASHPHRADAGREAGANISLVATAELAYSVDIERACVRVSGKDHLASMALRVTTVFRLEDDEWKMLHRHADPLLGLQTPQSVTQT